MNLRITLTILVAFAFSNGIAQCPGSIAQGYKTQLQNAGTNMEATTAYSHLANFYNYKCKCENGVTNPTELATFINNYASSYAGVVSGYGTMTPVNGCKGLGNGTNASSINASSGQSGNQRLNNTYQTAEDLTNAAFGADSDAGKLVQNLNSANKMYNAIDNQDYLGAATNLLNIFSNSKRRQPRPLTPEEIARLEALQLQKEKAERITLFNSAKSQLGLAKINDTTLVRIGEGEKIVITHQPMESSTTFLYNSRRTYNLETNDLLKEIIINQRNSNGSIKMATETNYLKGISTRTSNNFEGEVVTIRDMITDEIVYNTEGRIKEDILNEKGKVIGERFSYNGVTFLENTFGRKKFVKKSVYYHGGIKNIETHFVLTNGDPIPEVIIDYDNQGMVTKKTEATYKQISKNIRIVTLYENGNPIKKTIYKDGSVSSEEKL